MPLERKVLAICDSHDLTSCMRHAAIFTLLVSSSCPLYDSLQEGRLDCKLLLQSQYLSGSE